MRAYAGKRGVIEVIDGLDLDSYAWVAVARIDPPVAVVPRLDPEVVGRRSIAAAQLAEAFGLLELEPAVRVIVLNKLAEPSIRAAAARTLNSFHTDPRRSALIRIVADPQLSVGLREAILTDAASADQPASKELVGKVARELSARLQASLAESLAETGDGAALLLTLIEERSLAASHLQSAAIQAKLRSHGDGRFAEQVAKLTSALPPIEEKTRQLIAARSQGFVRAGPMPHAAAWYLKRTAPDAIRSVDAELWSALSSMARACAARSVCSKISSTPIATSIPRSMRPSWPCATVV